MQRLVLVVTTTPLLTRPRMFIRRTVSALLRIRRLIANRRRHPNNRQHRKRLPASLDRKCNHTDFRSAISTRTRHLRRPIRSPRTRNKIALLTGNRTRKFHNKHRQLFNAEKYRVNRISLLTNHRANANNSQHDQCLRSTNRHGAYSDHRDTTSLPHVTID